MKQGRGYKRERVSSAPTWVGVGKAIVLISKKKRRKRRKVLGRRVGDVGKPIERGTRRSSSLFS